MWGILQIIIPLKKAALKVFSQLGQLIEEDEKLNNNHVLLHELPDDIMKK